MVRYHQLKDFIWFSSILLLSSLFLGIQARIPHYIQLLCLILLSVTVSYSVIFMILTEYWSDSLSTISIFGFVWCFLLMRLGLWVWGGIKNKEVKCPSHYIILGSTWFLHYLWLVILTLASLFLPCKVTIFPFPYSVLWKQVTKSNPH